MRTVTETGFGSLVGLTIMSCIIPHGAGSGKGSGAARQLPGELGGRLARDDSNLDVGVEVGGPEEQSSAVLYARQGALRGALVDGARGEAQVPCGLGDAEKPGTGGATNPREHEGSDVLREQVKAALDPGVDHGAQRSTQLSGPGRARRIWCPGRARG